MMLDMSCAPTNFSKELTNYSPKYTNFYFHWQCMRTSIAPHPYQYLVSTDFLIFANLSRMTVFSLFKFHFPTSETEYLIDNLYFLYLCVAFDFSIDLYLYV